MAPQTPSSDILRPGKRKGAPPNNSRGQKRMKLQDQRAISNETTDKAFSNGELNVDKFVRAREFEIKALEEGIKNSRHGLSTRAFQEVPRDMRRRTASHNVKRVPKRARARARREMAEDNTPTVTRRRRKLTPHQRLRLETAKRLQTLSAKSKKRRREKKNAVKADAVKVTATDGDTPDKGLEKPVVKQRKATVKKAKLCNPDTPPVKFRKRQIHKTWLPTHMYHAKRATMTAPTEPLWRFALPLSPANKVYRVTHRASTMRGAVVWDTSYVSTIGLEGPQKSIEGLLKALGVGCEDDREGVWKSQGFKWSKGTRAWEGWLYKRENWPSKAIAPATVIWNPVEEQSTQSATIQTNGEDLIEKKLRKLPKRQAFLRIHPGGFLQVWDQVTRLAKVQKPMVSVEDLRFEIGSIELVGPNSTEALVETLWPTLPVSEGELSTSFESIWALLKTHPDPSVLPRNAVLSFSTSDPRLHFPAKKEESPIDPLRLQESLEMLVKWPLDSNALPAAIFNRNDRLKAKRNLPSQQSINRRKSAATPGSYPEPRPTDPRIPLLLFTSRSHKSKQTTWTVMLPWKIVLPVWSCLTRYALSCGGQPRFGGLIERHQLAFETGTPWFPVDFPGTKAGDDWEIQEGAKRKKSWERKPKGRRVEYDSIKLGNGRKGEIGLGWRCDWGILDERPALLVPERNGDGGDVEMVDAQPMTTFYHLPTSFASRLFCQREPDTSSIEFALVTVRITMLARGVPKICARIYRLPSKDPDLRRRWIAQKPLPKSRQLPKGKSEPHPPPKNAPPEVFRGYLAANILNDGVVQPGSEGYPFVPDQEDLVGFITTGNYNLGEGMGTGIGSILVKKVLPLESDVSERRLCIVRDSGEVFGRLARWALV